MCARAQSGARPTAASSSEALTSPAFRACGSPIPFRKHCCHSGQNLGSFSIPHAKCARATSSQQQTLNGTTPCAINIPQHFECDVRPSGSTTIRYPAACTACSITHKNDGNVENTTALRSSPCAAMSSRPSNSALTTARARRARQLASILPPHHHAHHHWQQQPPQHLQALLQDRHNAC